MTNEKNQKLLPILTTPHPFLRTKAKPVSDATSPEIKSLVNDMILTMRNGKGIGLAAIQVNVDARIIIIETKDGAVSLINPEILACSSEVEIQEEGCLSIPKTTGLVERFQSIKVKALDTNGNQNIHETHGLFARVIQHEIDHLNGILYTDKLVNLD